MRSSSLMRRVATLVTPRSWPHQVAQPWVAASSPPHTVWWDGKPSDASLRRHHPRLDYHRRSLVTATTASPPTPTTRSTTPASPHAASMTGVHLSSIRVTMRDTLSHALHGHRHNTAIIYNDQRITYGELDERSSRLARVLRYQFGVTAEQHICICSPNDPRYIETYYANAKLGSVTCPAVHLLSARELVNVINNTHAALILVHHSMMTTIMEIQSQLTTVRTIIVINDDVKPIAIPDGCHDYESLLQSSYATHGSLHDIDIDPNSIATMFITSGTTGLPKAAMYSHHAVVELVKRSLFGFTSTSILPYTNLCAWIGAVDMTVSMFAAGGTIILMPTNDITKWWRALIDYNATHALFLPGVMHYVANMTQSTRTNDRDDITRLAKQLHTMVYVGGTIPVRIIGRIVRGLPRTNIIQTYGLTECVGITSLTNDDHHILRVTDEHVLPTIASRLTTAVDKTNNDIANANATMTDMKTMKALHRMESCGRLMFGASLHILGTRTNGITGAIERYECARGDEGEMIVRAPNMMTGYYGRDEDTAAVLYDGYFFTGDIGYIDDDGYLFLRSRIKDVINPPAGIKVYPREVEDVLSWNTLVKEVAVVGHMNEQLTGQDIVAFVVLHASSSSSSSSTNVSDRLLQWCHGQMAAYKCPTRIIMIDNIPKNANNKPLKHVLQQQLVASTGRRAM